ncbi:uncharacterized protein LOC107418735 isoform X5 [Ziziphus jujuba]|uniref:Uncharacterized protein LOC107418735 isoform X5 n=1 Tax=Ziziphus jujuba TaxID=326968 RepID=A0ABM3IH94_ZIZJJ|nr:uncharacterized protein LOC107418735 isoform X5 [Ziziphus jujuba]
MRLYFCMHIYMFDVFDRVVTVIYSVMRDYRKGNWTVSETMILIEAKKMDDERRLMKRISSSSSNNGDQNTHDQSSSRSGKPAELRWKWVEDYCWRKGCMRSQNQCNDKWDNLMRDYKKVRDYERKLVDEGSSYWNIEKNERKERNLPTNMLPQIYEALVEVVEKKAQQRVNVMALTATTTTTGGGGTTSSVIVVPSSSPSPNVLSYVHHHQLSLPTPIPSPLMPPPLMLQHHHISAPPSMAAAAAALPLPSPHIAAAPILPASQTQQPLSLPYSHPLPTILIQVSLQSHQQKGGEEGVEVEVEREQALALLVQQQPQQQVMINKWGVLSPEVLPSLLKHLKPVRREKIEGTEMF